MHTRFDNRLRGHKPSQLDRLMLALSFCFIAWILLIP
jgi:hypothetical protein